MSIDSARRQYISEIVYKIIKMLDIRSYPIDIACLIKHLDRLNFDITLDTYQSFAAFRGISIEECIQLFKSKDAATAYIRENDFYIIFLNTAEKNKGRLHWTLAHELGHILLGHYKIIKPTLLQRKHISQESYQILEKEADFFAKSLLCHPYVLSQCGTQNPYLIKKTCRISTAAAKNRVSEIKQIRLSGKKPLLSDFWLIKQFHDFAYKRHCSLCGSYFISQNANFCPVCGNPSLRWDGTDAEEPNERIQDESVFCAGCGHMLHKNDNFCPSCGAEQIQKENTLSAPKQYLLKRRDDLYLQFGYKANDNLAGVMGHFTVLEYNSIFLLVCDTSSTANELCRNKKEAERCMGIPSSKISCITADELLSEIKDKFLP